MSKAATDSHGISASESTTKPKQRGHLIVIEGLDRSGKTTQCQTLCEQIRSTGKQVKYIKFPDRTTPSGQLIDAYLRGTAEQNDQAIHLLFSANRWEAVQGILDAVSAGTTVIVDRYSFSGAVYSAAKENPRLSLAWAWNPEIGLPQPDLVLFLDVSEEDAARRGGYGEERYEREEMQRRVRGLFAEVLERLGKADGAGLRVCTIDAGRELREVAEQIWREYERLDLGSSGLGELRTLPAL